MSNEITDRTERQAGPASFLGVEDDSENFLDKMKFLITDRRLLGMNMKACEESVRFFFGLHKN